jgi:hypothetical protein
MYAFPIKINRQSRPPLCSCTYRHHPANSSPKTRQRKILRIIMSSKPYISFTRIAVYKSLPPFSRPTTAEFLDQVGFPLGSGQHQARWEDSRERCPRVSWLGYVFKRSKCSVKELRQLVAGTIQKRPDLYSEAVLEQKRDAYPAATVSCPPPAAAACVLRVDKDGVELRRWHRVGHLCGSV